MIWSAVLLLLTSQIDVQVYLNSNYVNRLTHEEDNIWWATTGGVVCFRPGEEEYIQYSNADGLLQNNVVDISIDSEGNKYLLHQTEGLTILSPDGNCDTLFDYELGAPGDSLTAVLILEDKLMIGTNNGFSFDGEQELVNNRINRIKFFSDTLWFCTQAGIAKVRFAEIEEGPWVFDSLDGLASNFVNDLVVAPNGIWVATDQGTGRFSGSGWIPDTAGLPSLEVRTIVALDTAIWVGTDNGTARRLDGRWVVKNDSLLSKDVRVLSFDGYGRLWAGTWGEGIAQYNAEWTHWISPGPASNFINEVFIGKDGELWCTHFECFNHETKTPALSRFQRDEWTIFERTDFGDLTNFASGAIDGEGNRWFTTFGRGVLEYTSSDSFIIYNEENSGLPSSNISAVLIDGVNNRFFSFYVTGGVGEGVSCLLSDDSTWVTFSMPAHTQSICELAQDQMGTVWLGSCRVGYVSSVDFMGTLANLADDEWGVYTSDALSSGGEIHALAVDRENRVWVGTANGIRIITFEEISGTYYDEDNSDLRSNLIYDIEFDSRGGVWIATDNGLSHIWADGKWDNTHYPLPNEEVKSIGIDYSEKVIWVGTRHGLCKILPDWNQEDLEELMDMVVVYPNPLLPTTYPRMVVFRYVPPGARIRIYTLSGKLVAELASCVWDATDGSGARAASGIYIYQIIYGGVSKVGKFAIIN